MKMVTVYDVPAEKLILKTAQKLKENDKIVPPEWAEYAKTGRHTERAPFQEDWWYTRAASVLRKLYVKGPMGSSKLAAEYGGYADNGSMPNKAVKGSRNIARKCMMQLEAAGYLVSKDKMGRAISPKGQSLLDNTAKEVFDESGK
jgi:small subunit ribosomal protein S19e